MLRAVAGVRDPAARLPQASVTHRLRRTHKTQPRSQAALNLTCPPLAVSTAKYRVTSRVPRAHKRSQTTMSSPASQPDRKKARRAWTGACRTCGARFSGDGAWNTRAAHERACGQSIAPIPVTREASDEVPYRDPASPQSLVRRASLSKRPDAEETPAPRVSGRARAAQCGVVL